MTAIGAEPGAVETTARWRHCAALPVVLAGIFIVAQLAGLLLVVAMLTRLLRRPSAT